MSEEKKPLVDTCPFCGHDEDEHRDDGSGGVVCNAWPDDGTENCDCYTGGDNEDDGPDDCMGCGTCDDCIDATIAHFGESS